VGVVVIDGRVVNECLHVCRQVVEVLFAYLAMLKTVGPQEWVFKEMAALERMDYDW
jgi:secreted Zn-dependent insulinase-like peptidase